MGKKAKPDNEYKIALYAAEENGYAAELVRYGMLRSYTSAQVSSIIYDDRAVAASVYVFVSPGLRQCELVKKYIDENVKILIFGNLPTCLAEAIGVRVVGLPLSAKEWDECLPAKASSYSESDGRVYYETLPPGLECPIRERALLRYDFLEEWNNLGYGHLRTDGSIWSIAQQAKVDDDHVTCLARVINKFNELSVYITLSSQKNSELLWVNRQVGLIDTHEFRLIETFISNYRPDQLPCLPMVREIPYGYDAMCTMRLDCDEAVLSASGLFELYRAHQVPMSLAIKTGQSLDSYDIELMSDVLRNGGSLLSHSVNHKVNWGDDEDDVRTEARKSKTWIEKHVPEMNGVVYAVSPFHQNPDYAVNALQKERYKGFIGGIICNDPQFLVARAGSVFGIEGIVTHSQQCMLHGDCVLGDTKDPMRVYKEAALIAMDSGAIFGYLDHPFSDYHYGWKSEEQRLDFHARWIEFLKGQGRVLFASETTVLRQVSDKSAILLTCEDNMIRSNVENIASQYPFAIEYKGDLVRLN